MKEKTGTARDIYLCDEHAEQVMNKLLEYHGAATGDVTALLQQSSELIRKLMTLLNNTLDTKDRKITVSILEKLLLADGKTKEELKGLSLKGTKEAVNMYLGYDTREFTIEELKVIEVADKLEENKKEFEESMKEFDPGLTDEELEIFADLDDSENDPLLEAIKEAEDKESDD